MLQGFTAVIEKWWADGYLASDAQLRGLFTATTEAMYQGRGALGLAEGGVSFFLSLRPHPLIFVWGGANLLFRPITPSHSLTFPLNLIQPGRLERARSHFQLLSECYSLHRCVPLHARRHCFAH